MYDYYLKFDSEGEWLSLDLSPFDRVSIDVIGVIYMGEEQVPLDGFHVNMRIRRRNLELESIIGQYAIEPPETPYRVWA